MWSRSANRSVAGVHAEVIANIPKGLSGSELVLSGYEWYRENYNTSSPSQRAMNGILFERLVIDALRERDILPVYYQATVMNVPSVVYDILLFHPRRPVVLSCKTSLRERWKQADLEGLALKQVYRGARSVLLTLSEEGNGVQREIERSNVLGLDSSIVISRDSDRFDRLLDELRTIGFIRAVRIEPVSGRYIQ